jgi:hypothetical protein
VWCGLSSRGTVGPFLFEATVTGAAYSQMLQDNIVPFISSLFLQEQCYFLQDNAPPHYHSDVSNFVKLIFLRDGFGVGEGRGPHPDLLT